MSSDAAARIPPKGVFVPTPTFFHPETKEAGVLQSKLDVDTQIKHSIFLAKAGITGLVLLGSTGEAIHLNRSERFDLVSGVRKGLDDAGFPDYPIMAGVLTNGIDETIEWLQDYARAGAQWGLVLVPGYFGAGASQDNIVEWYNIIAETSPIPILVYNYPGVTNQVLIQPETYIKLAAHPKIVGCKMSHGNVSHHVQVSLDPEIDHDNFRVYSGFGQQLGPIVFFGAAGVIDGMAAFYPKTVVRLMALAEKGEINAETKAEIHRLQFVVSRAEEFVVRYGLIGIKEAVFRVTGLGIQGSGRLPVKGSLSDSEWEKGRSLFLASIEEIEASL
ncbi:Dihydrodipicolinate synthetase-like protein [Apodospora peruviana]|uniref:Dihydrodipicolinate synthetase-like protein n=1 Tax=Apodospora peruviana TaxID=516989 RepID=A0AAE0HU94_9PEZI|nr:Dihydrodipicolinate synthetase-like protein [Apodospora peruviana]